MNQPTDVDSALTVKIYERLFAGSAVSLTDAELLAALISVPPIPQRAVRLAEMVCARQNGVRGLVHASLDDLMSIDGLSEGQVIVLLSMVELSRRMHGAHTEENPMIATAADAAHMLTDMGELAQEHVRVMLLDPQRRLIRISTIYIGTLNTAVVRASEIFREAIIHSSAAIVLAHNHPSGTAAPSPEDVDFTRMMVAAGELLDIRVLDHIIIARGEWVSLREMGLI